MQTQTADFTALRGTNYISLTTFRKTGDPVSTPVWFAEEAGILYFYTFPAAGKLKRIRHTPRVTVAPCTLGGKVTGPAIEGKARILTEEQEKMHADQTMARKYALIWRLYNGSMEVMRIIRRRPKSARVYVAIEPAS